MGESFKAICKVSKLKTGFDSDIGAISDEVADIAIYTRSIANRLNIGIEQSFRDKEGINTKRT